VPIGIAMGIAGVGGFALLSGMKPALNLLANVPLSVVTDYNLSVIPMFILMGAFASQLGHEQGAVSRPAGPGWATCAAAWPWHPWRPAAALRPSMGRRWPQPPP
jgi:uncharacterized membrane protein YfcA